MTARSEFESLLRDRVLSTIPAGCAVQAVDVIVVGGGGAGLAAASSAAELGRSVVLLEKNAALGGTTAWSVGSVSASNTPHQRRAGIRDSPQDHWEDLGRFSGAEIARDNRELAHVLTDQAPATFEWLLATGLRFVGPMPEPPHRRPRMHNVLPNSKAFPFHLGRYCRKRGVRIELGMSVDALLVEDGRVTGVMAVAPDATRVVWRARGGVVLAAGDFSASAAMKSRYASPRLSTVDPMNPTSTGDGIILGIAAGGIVRNGDHLRGPFLRFVPPSSMHWLQKVPPHRFVTTLMAWGYRHLPPALLRPLLMRFVTTSLAPDVGMLRAGAVLVDLQGRRVDVAGRSVHDAVAAAPKGQAYIVFDSNTAKRFTAWPNFVSTAPGVAYAYLDDYRRTRPDIFHEGTTVEALATKLDVDPAVLADSLSADALETRSPEATRGSGSLYALGPAKAYVVFTNGGLSVSPRLEVTNAEGLAIPGLYAAGSNGQGGLLLEGHGHHLIWAFVSGRIAGREAAYASTTPSVS